MNESYGPCFYKLYRFLLLALPMVTMEQGEEGCRDARRFDPKKKNTALTVQ
jgi:hypothetical protein